MCIRSISRRFVFLLSLFASLSATATSYERAEWLPRWSDFDSDCQDTRHELLVRYSLAPITFTRTDNCKVATGLWLDPYTGNFYSKASDLDVEHIVPLKWAHERGGAHWSREQKRRFAEDPDNLWLVDDGRNQSKGDRGPDEWMPPYAPVSRIYVQRFMAIVQKYGLQPSIAEVSRFEALAAGS
ncbi:HNH endonuclease family protein [Microbulbifer taiwanensis]|uniref:HNH endonuclease family protein n=1 Tax=Microbulbifer taiwanensis TaxID=986746 RepID=A0ABW1YHV0_9GAMM|nr:HNH endonuclease family protein [Microbulbifer taiwanensis]